MNEQFLTGTIWFFSGYIFTTDAINITLLTRKYDQTGALVKEIRTPAVRRRAIIPFVDVDVQFSNLGKSEPFFVDNNGALSLFIETKPDEITDSTIPTYKYMLINHRAVF